MQQARKKYMTYYAEFRRDGTEKRGGVIGEVGKESFWKDCAGRFGGRCGAKSQEAAAAKIKARCDKMPIPPHVLDFTKNPRRCKNCEHTCEVGPAWKYRIMDRKKILQMLWW